MQSVLLPVLLEADIKKLESIRDFIDHNIEADLGIHALSKMFGIGSSTLKRHFAQYYGLPVFRYIQNRRMETAMELLTGRKLPVAQTALAVGYKDRSAFTHIFTRYFLHPPAYFLRN